MAIAREEGSREGERGCESGRWQGVWGAREVEAHQFVFGTVVEEKVSGKSNKEIIVIWCGPPVGVREGEVWEEVGRTDDHQL